ncbi:unnamed protein product [Urochloa humidicola]
MPGSVGSLQRSLHRRAGSACPTAAPVRPRLPVTSSAARCPRPPPPPLSIVAIKDVRDAEVVDDAYSLDTASILRSLALVAAVLILGDASSWWLAMAQDLDELPVVHFSASPLVLWETGSSRTARGWTFTKMALFTRLVFILESCGMEDKISIVLLLEKGVGLSNMGSTTFLNVNHMELKLFH